MLGVFLCAVYTMLHRTRYQLQRAAGRADTIVRVIVKHGDNSDTVIYSGVLFFDVVEYGEIPKQNNGIRFLEYPNIM